MPHQCTNCNKVFPDGSKEMLSGCPQCGGNKFQFRPPGTEVDSSAKGPADGSSANRTATETLSASESTDRSDDGLADRVAGSGSTVRDWVDDRLPNRESADAAERDRSDDTIDAVESDDAADGDGEVRSKNEPQTSTPGDDATAATEDRAQATARSDVVSPAELPETPGPPEDGETPPPDPDGRVIEPTSDHRPGLEELREELNEQFESIRVVNPGQYELNLMELYDREEYIISLQEDGRYVIEVPDAWTAADEEE